MGSILEHCQGLDQRRFAAGELLIEEDRNSGRLFVLVDGVAKVFRNDSSDGETDIVTVAEPGSIFGEMSALLGLPHTASVRAMTDTQAYVVENAAAFLQSRPEFTLPVAQLLARRLHSATSYLVNLKQQFQDFENHFGMVDEVLESLTHQQDEDFAPTDEIPPDPRL